MPVKTGQIILSSSGCKYLQLEKTSESKMQVFNQNRITTKDTVHTQGLIYMNSSPQSKRKHCQRLRKHQPAVRSCTYISNDRELADSTEDVVPNPCAQEDTRKASVSKTCRCNGKQKKARHRGKEPKSKESMEQRKRM